MHPKPGRCGIPHRLLDIPPGFTLDSKINSARTPMIELQFYVPGLRTEEKMMQFNHQTDMLAARCKVDAQHDMVYFEIKDPTQITLQQVTDIFENIGLVPRLVGTLPPEIIRGDAAESIA
jgi:hypothetical protein